MGAIDKEGNPLSEGDIVYFCDAKMVGSNSKKMLRGRIEEIHKSGNKADVYCGEAGRTYTKLCSRLVRPMVGGRYGNIPN